MKRKATSKEIRKPKRLLMRVLVFTGLSILFIGGLIVCLTHAPRVARSDTVAEEDASSHLPAVRVEPVRWGALTRWLIATGRVECLPAGVQTLTARTSGVVSKVLKQDMEFVSAGDVIYKLDEQPCQVALARAKAVLAEREAELAQFEHGDAASQLAELEAAKKEAETQLVEASRIAEHYAKLSKKDLISARKYAEAQDAVHVAQAHVAAAEKKLEAYQRTIQSKQIAVLRARVEQAKADVQDQLLRLRWCSIKAERSGVLTGFVLHPGEHIDSGTNVGKIINPEKICAIVHVPFKHAIDVRVGAEVHIRSLGKETFDAAGTVEAISSSMPQEGATVPVRVSLSGGTERKLTLRPGQFVLAWIAIGKTPKGIIVPEKAIIQEEGSLFIYVLASGSIAKKLAIASLNRDPDGSCVVTVQGKLAPGDQVIVDGAYNLPDGAKVEVQKP